MKNLPPDKKKLAEKILKLLHANGIDAMLMKLYSDDDDLDTVIIDKEQYVKAAALLRSNQWYLKNNKSKLRERDKDFFHHASTSYVVHLHQAFSWNTVTYLDSKILWKRKRLVEGLMIPSIEDELLIIGAHSLFENQCIKPEEVIYGRQLLSKNVDFKYIYLQAKAFHWEKGIEIILDKLKENESSLGILNLIKVKINKLKLDIKSGLLGQTATEALNYLFIDWIWNYRIMLIEKMTKRPIIISISGVDGSGKTTVVKALYQLFLQDGKQVKITHSGDTPLIKKTEKTFLLPGMGYVILIKDLLQIFLAIFINKKHDVLIFDRYSYDTMVKIAYKQKKETISKSFLTIAQRLSPMPNLALLLETSPVVSHKRDRDHSIEYHQIKHILYHDLLAHVPQMIKIETAGSKKNVISIIKEKIKPFLTTATL